LDKKCIACAFCEKESHKKKKNSVLLFSHATAQEEEIWDEMAAIHK
jgi:hypothetical protein